MKKILAGMLSMLLLVLPAFADEPAPTEPADADAVPDEPSLTYPRDRYGDIYMDETDGSDQMVFMLLDAMNDEEAAIAEYGCLNIEMRLYQGADAAVTVLMQNFYIGSVRCSLSTYSINDVVLLYVGDKCYKLSESGVEESLQESMSNFDQAWTMWRFPFDPPGTLHGVREDGAFLYYLVSASGGAIEYVTSGLEIVESRLYSPDGAGGMVLNAVVRYSTGEKPTLPEEFTPYLPQEDAPADSDGAAA